MAERTFNSNSHACEQWELLLTDSLDGLLKPGDEAAFKAHRAVCPACSALYEEASRGREWLEFLSPEPEVPAGLLDKILAQTGPGHEAGYTLATAGGNVVPIRPVSVPAWQRPGLVARIHRFAEPRLLMTAAMAFFSIAMTLNITGVKLSNLRLSDLRPSIMRSYMERQFNMASTPIIRYYDNSRLAYELLKTMRELSQTAGVGEQREGEDNQQKQQNQTPGESNQIPVPGNGGQQTYPPQLPDSLAAGPAFQPDINNSDFLETSLTFQQRSAHSGGSEKETWERGTKWIA
ncbi:MAG: zf-HC2 domain-containing protein [Terracidiphilus sp.]|jgi:hypothetical protein